MAGLEATLLVETSEPVKLLLDGEVRARGMVLHVGDAVSIDDNCRRMAKLDFDLAEVSIGTYMKARAQGLPVIGTVIREDLANEHPEVVESVCGAFVRAKAAARAHSAAGASESGDIGEIGVEMLDVVGGDPWPLGITANRRSLEAFVATAHDQGLVSRPYPIEELFARKLPDDMR